MGRTGRIFYLSKERDVEEVHRLLFADDSDSEDDNFSDSSGSDSDFVEERVENSDTDHECEVDESVADEEPRHCSSIYTGKDNSKWSAREPARDTRTRSHNLLVHLPGVRGKAVGCKTPEDSWYCIIDDSMLNIIVEHTNQYIDSIKGKYSRERDCKNTNKIEIKAFIGLLYLAGLLRNNRLHVRDMWSSDGMDVEMFRTVMSVNRFYFLIRCMRFDDKDTRELRKNTDKLAAVHDIFTQFVDNCKACYSLGENVTIDEKLEYIPSKPAKYGIKIFALVDAKMYYASNLEVYVGQQLDGPFKNGNSGSEIVVRLSEHIYGSGRNITGDNWFTSVELVEKLKKHKLSYVGTIRKNKRELPVEFVSARDREPRSSIFDFRNEMTLVSYVPKKGKTVVLLSSLHYNAAIDEESGDLRKPEIITFYNAIKSGVDVSDEMTATYNVARNTRRWPMVVFYSMLNIAAVNAQVIYLGNKNESKYRRQFLKQLVRDLTAEHIEHRAQSTRGIPSSLQLRLQGRNEQEKIGSGREEYGKRKRCEPCFTTKKTRLTKYHCIKCNKWLCLQHAKIVLRLCNEQNT